MTNDSIFIRPDQWVKQNDEHPMFASWLRDTESILDDIEEIYDYESTMVFVKGGINQMVCGNTVINRKGMRFSSYGELLDYLKENKPFIQYIVTVMEKNRITMTNEQFCILWCFDVEGA